MGDVAFGRSFDLLETGKDIEALDLLAEGMKPLGVLGPAPWIFCILTSIPGLSAGFKTFVAWAAEQIHARKKVGFGNSHSVQGGSSLTPALLDRNGSSGCHVLADRCRCESCASREEGRGRAAGERFPSHYCCREVSRNPNL